MFPVKHSQRSPEEPRSTASLQKPEAVDDMCSVKKKMNKLFHASYLCDLDDTDEMKEVKEL